MNNNAGILIYLFLCTSQATSPQTKMSWDSIVRSRCTCIGRSHLSASWEIQLPKISSSGIIGNQILSPDSSFLLKKNLLIICTVIDDIPFTSDDPSVISEFKQNLQTEFANIIWRKAIRQLENGFLLGQKGQLCHRCSRKSDSKIATQIRPLFPSVQTSPCTVMMKCHLIPGNIIFIAALLVAY